MKNKIVLFSFLILVIPFISSYPGIPHQFYGNVVVNDKPAPDNNILTASIEGEVYRTVTQNGKYGISPNIFYIEDPNADRIGKTVFFYVGGKSAGSSVFENNGYTKLDFSLTTFLLKRSNIAQIPRNKNFHKFKEKTWTLKSIETKI